MRNVRIIGRLDVKAPRLVKGIQMEGLRKLGDPNAFALRYYEDGIDEIYYEDIVASLFERNSLLDIIAETSRDIFVPITVGGGIRSVEDVAAALRAGADKVAINTAAIKSPSLIRDVANRFGSQCMVLSIQAKNTGRGWEAYYDNGRERSGLDVIEWARRGQELGAGEILLTSVDRDGTKKGFDVDLVREVSSLLSIPLIASGGMGALDDFENVVLNGGADGVALASVLHYDLLGVRQIREFALSKGLPVRRIKT